MRSSSVLLAANLSEAVLPFVRNIALARLIAPTEFGLAISLSVVLGMIEVITDFGLPIFAVRKKTPVPVAETMRTLQSLALMRSFVLGLVLVAISPWVAAAFKAPHSAWVYSLLGLIAVLRGFENYGTKEAMRDFVFWREAVVVAGTQTVWLVVTVLVAAVSHGFECMIWGMLAGTTTMIALSHLLSPRVYRLGWNRVAVDDATRFGRPLLVNGFAVSLNMADRLLVGGLLGPAVLAVYNVDYGTAMLPRTVLTKFLTSAFLPLFVHERDHPNAESNLHDTWAWCLSCIGFCYGLGLGLIGDRLLGLVFTANYQPSRLFMSIAGISVCVKFLMLLPVPSAYAAGNTKLVTLGSIFSALAILPGAVALFFTRDLNLFLLAMTATEFIALLTFTRAAMREQRFTRRSTWMVIAVPIALLASLAIMTRLLPDMTFAVWLGVSSTALLISAGFYVAIVLRFRLGLRALLA